MAPRRPLTSTTPQRVRWRRKSWLTAARRWPFIASRSAARPAVLAALPIDRVEPTPYQRDPSEPHVKRLMNVIEKLGSFLDPIIAVRRDEHLLDAER